MTLQITGSQPTPHSSIVVQYTFNIHSRSSTVKGIEARDFEAVGRCNADAERPAVHESLRAERYGDGTDGLRLSFHITYDDVERRTARQYLLRSVVRAAAGMCASRALQDASNDLLPSWQRRYLVKQGAVQLVGQCSETVGAGGQDVHAVDDVRISLDVSFNLFSRDVCRECDEILIASGAFL